MRQKLSVLTLVALVALVALLACAGPQEPPGRPPDVPTAKAKPPKDGKLQFTLSLEMPDSGLAGAIIYAIAEDAELKCGAVRGPWTTCDHSVWEDVIDLETTAGEFTLTYTPGGRTADILIPLADPAIERALVLRSVEAPASILRIIVVDLKRNWERRGEATVGKVVLIGSPGVHTVYILIARTDDDDGYPVLYGSAEVPLTIPRRGPE